MNYQRGTKLYFTGYPGFRHPEPGKKLYDHPVVLIRNTPRDINDRGYDCADMMGNIVHAYHEELSTQRVTGEKHDEQDPQR